MYKSLILIMMTALMGLSNLTVFAQDEEQSCDEVMIAEAADIVASLAEDLRDASNPMDVLRELTQRASRFIASCEGLVFTSEKEGMQPVIGPIEIPEGIYRVSATTSAAFILHSDALTGECGEGRYMSGFVLNISSGQAIDGAEVVFYSTGCETLLSVSNTREAWELTFEKIR